VMMVMLVEFAQCSEKAAIRSPVLVYDCNISLADRHVHTCPR
jgi:hypothetical protein